MPRAIAMHHRPFVQIRDRGQPDMRMRPHIDAAASPEFDRPHMIQEHERPHGALLRRRQRPPNLESAQIAAARHHHRSGSRHHQTRSSWSFLPLNPATMPILVTPAPSRHPPIAAKPPSGAARSRLCRSVAAPLRGSAAALRGGLPHRSVAAPLGKRAALGDLYFKSNTSTSASLPFDSFTATSSLSASASPAFSVWPLATISPRHMDPGTTPRRQRQLGAFIAVEQARVQPGVLMDLHRALGAIRRHQRLQAAALLRIAEFTPRTPARCRPRQARSRSAADAFRHPAAG